MMPKRIIRFLRSHTGAGKYIESVEHGTAIQQDKVRELSDPELGKRLNSIWDVNHVVPRISELFQGRY